MSNATMTFDNPIPAGLGTLTYIITDGFKHQAGFTVPPNGKVQHPVDPTCGPWNISATLNGASVTNPSLASSPTLFTDPNAVITTTLNVVSAQSKVDSNPVPNSASTPPVPAPSTSSDASGLVPPARTSLLDQATWQQVGDPVPPVDASPKALSLIFAMQYQRQNQWCWAALAVSVAQYYTPTSTVTQCSMATWAFGNAAKVDCCTAQAGPLYPCNQPYQVDTALAYLGNLNPPTLNQSLLFSDVVNQIFAATPIGIRIVWQGGGNVGHALCITGYDCTDPSAANALIELKDPTYGATLVTFVGFPANYHNGQAWTHTYLTKAPS